MSNKIAGNSRNGLFDCFFTSGNLLDSVQENSVQLEYLPVTDIAAHEIDKPLPWDAQIVVDYKTSRPVILMLNNISVVLVVFRKKDGKSLSKIDFAKQNISDGKLLLDGWCYLKVNDGNAIESSIFQVFFRHQRELPNENEDLVLCFDEWCLYSSERRSKLWWLPDSHLHVLSELPDSSLEDSVRNTIAIFCQPQGLIVSENPFHVSFHFLPLQEVGWCIVMLFFVPCEDGVFRQCSLTSISKNVVTSGVISWMIKWLVRAGDKANLWIAKMLSLPRPYPGMELCIDDIRFPVGKLLPAIEYQMEWLFDYIEIKVLVLVFKFILLEKKILFVAESIGVLSGVFEILSKLLFPFEWQFLWMICIPNNLSHLLQSPMPFLLGCLYNQYSSWEIPDDVYIVDIDGKNLKQPVNIILPLMPFSDILIISLMNKTNVQIAFLSFMRQLLSKYAEYLEFPLDVPITEWHMDIFFKRQLFIDSKAFSDQLFYDLLLKTQMFAKFIEERVVLSNDQDFLNKERIEGLVFFDSEGEKEDLIRTYIQQEFPISTLSSYLNYIFWDETDSLPLVEIRKANSMGTFRHRSVTTQELNFRPLQRTRSQNQYSKLSLFIKDSNDPLEATINLSLYFVQMYFSMIHKLIPPFDSLAAAPIEIFLSLTSRFPHLFQSMIPELRRVVELLFAIAAKCGNGKFTNTLIRWLDNNFKEAPNTRICAWWMETLMRQNTVNSGENEKNVSVEWFFTEMTEPLEVYSIICLSCKKRLPCWFLFAFLLRDVDRFNCPRCLKVSDFSLLFESSKDESDQRSGTIWDQLAALPLSSENSHSSGFSSSYSIPLLSFGQLSLEFENFLDSPCSSKQEFIQKRKILHHHLCIFFGILKLPFCFRNGSFTELSTSNNNLLVCNNLFSMLQGYPIFQSPISCLSNWRDLVDRSWISTMESLVERGSVSQAMHQIVYGKLNFPGLYDYDGFSILLELSEPPKMEKLVSIARGLFRGFKKNHFFQNISNSSAPDIWTSWNEAVKAVCWVQGWKDSLPEREEMAIRAIFAHLHDK